MTNLVQFPGPGLSFELDRVAFSIGGMNIYWYGVCIAVGMCLALVFAFRHSVEFGVDADAMVDVILIGVVMGILCARLYYVALSPYQYHSLKDVLAIRDGGLAIYGGIIGGVLTAIVYCKRKGVNFWLLADTIAPCLAFGQMLGRWGNFFNREAFGGFTNGLLAMRLQVSQVRTSDISAEVMQHIVNYGGVDYIQVHPTFLYESLWNLCLFLLLIKFRPKKRREKQSTNDAELKQLEALEKKEGKSKLDGD